jgi:hypothetical protein
MIIQIMEILKYSTAYDSGRLRSQKARNALTCLIHRKDAAMKAASKPRGVASKASVAKTQPL